MYTNTNLTIYDKFVSSLYYLYMDYIILYFKFKSDFLNLGYDEKYFHSNVEIFVQKQVFR